MHPITDPLASIRPEPHDVLSVRATVDDQVTVVQLDGPVCAYTADHLDAELAKLEAAGQHRLVIDARNVRPLCLDGIDVLVAHEQRCTAEGGNLVVRHLRPAAQRVLDVLSLQHLAAPLAVTA
jgi:anti-anti-sigma factor